MNEVIPDAALNDTRLELIVGSYQRLTGKSLLDAFDPLVLWNAPRAVVAHDTEEDPVFFYGNKLALQLFGMNFEKFTRLPSHLSADPVAQQTRAALLAKVAQKGFIDGYSGVRVAKDGTRFMIADTRVWNLLDEAGSCHGQAATFVAKHG